MDTRFMEIDGADVQNCFPKFYDGRGRFFEIVHQDTSIGFVGIRPPGHPFSAEDCELEVFVFRQYRNALTKGIVLAVLGLPKSLGFKKCWMKTAKKTVVKLFHSMKRYGILPAGMLNQQHVFVREFP